MGSERRRRGFPVIRIFLLSFLERDNSCSFPAWKSEERKKNIYTVEERCGLLY